MFTLIAWAPARRILQPRGRVPARHISGRHARPLAAPLTEVAAATVLVTVRCWSCGPARAPAVRSETPTAPRRSPPASSPTVRLRRCRSLPSPSATRKVRPGGHVPIDGVRERRMCRRVPAHRRTDSRREQPGDRVTGGTLNGTGAFDMCADRTGAGATLVRIVALVGEAQRSRAPIQALADRFGLVRSGRGGRRDSGLVAGSAVAAAGLRPRRRASSSSHVPARSALRRPSRSWSRPGAC